MKFYQIDQVKEDGKDFTMYIVADNVYDAFDYYRENWPNEIDQIVDFHLCEPFESNFTLFSFISLIISSISPTIYSFDNLELESYFISINENTPSLSTDFDNLNSNGSHK